MRRALHSFMRTAGFSLLVVAADQATKRLAVAYLRPIRSRAVIPGFFSFSYVENIGAAWGMLAGRQLFLILFTLLTLVWLFWKRNLLFGDSRRCCLIEPLLYGGIIGNLIDRIFFGHVVDFLDFHWGASHFPAFNVADSAICCGIFLCLLSTCLFPNRPADKIDQAESPPEK